jgi:hypothetical protein
MAESDEVGEQVRSCIGRFGRSNRRRWMPSIAGGCCGSVKMSGLTFYSVLIGIQRG